MVNVERIRRAIARLWPADADHVVFQHEQAVRFVVPGLTAKGRTARRFSLRRLLRRLPEWLLLRLITPDWLMLLYLLFGYWPTVVRAADPDGESARLARALIPVRMEGVMRRPWVLISPDRVSVFGYVLGEAVVRWSGVPTSVSVVRRLNGTYAQLWFLDGSTAVISISAADARLLR